ncbi:MAG: hypothetical protein KBG48_10800 [Kofleriaceae bacterium]|jgi:hypothetical protein|nr:hypothetical protein [Kofleriaceae bacterium]MBP9167870.1 hypothetical protein [Kofleriaceae bacterium]MBP9859377.1 hypothetical protein [Kofleriaceae bacterium]
MPTALPDPRTRLRTLIGAVDHQLTSSDAAAPVRAAFAALVDALALGPEPAMRACPSCGGPCRTDALRCGSCWKPLTALPAAKATATADAEAGAATGVA